MKKLKKKQQPKIKNRAEAEKIVQSFKNSVPNYLGETDSAELQKWHSELDTAIAYLERCGLPLELGFAKSLKLRLKDEIERREKSQPDAAEKAVAAE